MDRWEIPILNPVCHVNPGNEKSITWVQGCIRIHSQEPLSRFYWIKTPLWLKITLYKDKWTQNPLTCFRLQISLKANQFHLPKSVIASDFPTPTDVIVIKLIPSISYWRKQKYHPAQKRKTNKQKTKQCKLSPASCFHGRYYQS